MAQTAAKTAPATVLDITTEAPTRERVKIDGVSYELATMADLSLGDQLRVARSMPLFQKVSDLANVAELTDEELERIDAEVAWTVRRIVLDLPEATFAALADDQLLAIISCFKAAAPVEATPRARKASSSRAR